AGGDADFVHFYASRLEPGSAATADGALPEQDQDQPRLVARIASRSSYNSHLARQLGSLTTAIPSGPSCTSMLRRS
ncbi:MAG: hypothetical protein J0M17_19630, partial [Planctomycetes bacterium]|nr:hypothetical protein [Planctomycetota bacterium]